MEKREQRFVIKFFFLKGLGSKKIHRKLQDTIGESAYCRAEVKFWLARFREGDLSYKDHERVGRPLAVLGTVLHKFLTKHPFASARIMAEHFNLSHPIVKEILQREMGLRKFTRRWVPVCLLLLKKLNEWMLQIACWKCLNLRDLISSKESRLATSRGSVIVIVRIICMPNLQKRSFQGFGCQLQRRKLC